MRRRRSSPKADASWDYRSSSGQLKGRERERMRRRRSRSLSRGRRSRTRSSSSSSTGSSSRSSHSSSSRRSDYGRTRSGSRSPKHHSGDKYRSSSSPRSNRSNVGPRFPMKEGGGVSGHNHSNWYGNQGYAPGQEGYVPPQSHLSSSYSSNVSNQGFDNNYQGYQGYEASTYYQVPPPPAGEFPQQSSHDYVRNVPSSTVQGSNWDSGGVYHYVSKPPPSHISSQSTSGANEVHGSHQGHSDEAKKEAVEQELLQQKRTLAKQREDYIKRKISLNRDLGRLKDQKRELLQEHSKDNERILRENAKLQSEILQKLKSIDNVIEMLSGIIGDAAELPEVIKAISAKETPKKSDKRRHSDSPDSSHKVSRVTSEIPSPSVSETKTTGSVNLVHYDPELHWCADCDAFPKSMTDYLQHLHSEEHKKATAKTKLDDLPWHKAPFRENSPVFHNDLPNKRIPIRGVQFLKASTAWFCSICKVWIGDLHCAANHVRGTVHSNNYNEFTARNPHWEVDWITDRMRAYERKCGSDTNKPNTGGISGSDADSKKAGNPALDIASISDQLMQMIANANRQRNDSSEQQSSDSQETDSHGVSKKSKKSKKKKYKKKKKEEDIVPPAAIVKTSARGKITINLPSVGGVDSRSPEENDAAATWLKNQTTSKKSKQVEDSPDGLYDNINLAIRGANAERQKSLLSLSLSEYGDMNEDDNSYKKSSDCESPRDMRYGPREPPRRDKRGNIGNSSSLPSQSNKSSSSNSNSNNNNNSNSNARYERIRSEYSHSKERERRSDKDHYDYGHKDSKSPRSSKERNIHKEKEKEKKEQRNLQLRNKETIRSPESKVKQEKEPEKKPKLKSMLEKTNSPEETAETVFEKRTSESAAKKKDPKKALPKSKLPFIGRMPILKRKVEPKSYESGEDKREGGDFNLAEAMAKAEAAAAAVNQQILESEAVPLPKSTLIISKRPRLTEPEVVKKDAVLFKGKATEDNLTEQDMDIEEDHPKDELHKDFKDALDLLFPEEKKPEEKEETTDTTVPTTEVSGEIVETTSTYDVHSMMPSQAPTPYDIGMYHPPAAAVPPPAPEQQQYMGYYDQSMYIHQAAYMMGGYDPNQAIPPQAYPIPVEPNAQYMQQQHPGTINIPPPLPISNNSLPPSVPCEQLPTAANENNNSIVEEEEEQPQQPSDADDQENTGEDEKDGQKVKKKKKNPLSQRMRRHLKKKAEQAKTKEDVEITEQMEMELPSAPSTLFSATVDKSDLAMLGIEEDDITAQSFT